MNMVMRLLFFFVSTTNLYVFGNQIDPKVAYESAVFKNGNPEYIYEYRIPIIATGPINKTLVLFTQGRIGSGSDSAPKVLSYRYSEDQGLTWSNIGEVYNSSTNGSIFYGGVVSDFQRNTMHLLYTICHVPCSGSWSNYIVNSTDDGKTWSEARDITYQIGPIEFVATVKGIQKRYAPNAGRLIICGHTEPLTVDGIICIISDDHGETWNMGATLYGIPYGSNKVDGDFLPDENAIVELPNGTVLINARNQYHYYCYCRLSIVSSDGCETLNITKLWIDEDLVDPACSAGIEIFNDEVLLFTNPNSSTSRVNMTLKWSEDFGRTWNHGFTYWPLGGGYSSITAYRNYPVESKYNRVFVAYEKSYQLTGIDEISVAAIDLYGV